MKLDKAYWDSVAEIVYDADPDFAQYKREEHISLVKIWCDINKKTILKTDCYEEAKGRDYFLDWLSEKGRLVVGMDISSHILTMAKQRFNQSHFVVCDVKILPYREQSFDIIISNSTLDHFPTEDLSLALNEFYRILKKDGILILTLDNRDNPLYHMKYLLQNAKKRLPYYREKCYTLKETIQLVESARFNLKDYTAIVHVMIPVSIIKRILPTYFARVYGQLVFKLFRRLGRLPIRQFTGWFVAVLCVK